MKTFRFEGHSDDTFGFECGATGDDYDNCASGKPIRWRVVDADGGGYLVTGQYSVDETGCWSIAVAPVDEGRAPPWPMRLSVEGYTMVLEVDATDDATCECLEAKR